MLLKFIEKKAHTTYRSLYNHQKKKKKKKPLNQNSIYCRKKVNTYFFIEISRDSLEKKAQSLENAN